MSNNGYKPYKGDKIANLPTWFKLFAIKAWTAGAVFFFFYMGLTIFNVFPHHEDRFLLVGFVLILINEYFINMLIKHMKRKNFDVEDCAMFINNKWSLVYNFFYILIVVILTILLGGFIIGHGISLSKLLMPGEAATWEPIMFGVLYWAIDTLLIYIKIKIMNLLGKGKKIMKFNAILVTNRSASFELDNNDIYYAKEAFDVYVNDEVYLEDVKTNVFSIYDLEPNKDYDIKVKDFVLKIKTKNESASINVKDFGAKGDGKTNDTIAIQAAINAIPKDGTLIIPEGTYYTLPLFLKSDTTIDLKKGATLLGHTDRHQYPILPPFVYMNDGTKMELGHWEGVPQPIFGTILTGLYVENVNIIGEGVVDANAQNSDWWDEPIKPLGGAFRPRGVYINRGKNVSLQGITVKNTPSWNIHPIFSENIKVIDLYLESDKDSPNTDGCNPESSNNVDIIGVRFSVGDDCIAIKSGKMYPDMNKPVPMTNLTIRNCHMAYGHGAVVLGSEISGGIQDLNVSRCYFEHTDRGLRIKTRRGRGRDSIIDNVVFENIYMDHVLSPLTMNMFYNCVDLDKHSEYVWSKEKLPVDERTPFLGNFTFRDMVCDNVQVAAAYFYGLPEETIKSVTIENIEFNIADEGKLGKPLMMDYLDPMARQGIYAHNVDKLVIKNTKVNNQDGEPIVMTGVKEYIHD